MPPVEVGAAVTVTVPATSANLGPGFDALGLAVDLVDEVVAEVVATDEPALTVHVEGEGEGELPRDEAHLVVRALDRGLAHLEVPRPPLALRCTNRIPHGRGLGSSAAAAVAGLLLARGIGAAAGARTLDDDAVLTLATELEGHPDNAAACLLGGLTIAWQDGESVRAVRCAVAPEVRALLLVPSVSLATETARGLLPPVVPHADAAFTAGRAALLVEALSRRPDLLMAATEERLHQHYRAGAMPESARLLHGLRAAGLAAVVSGAGPSVLVLGAGDPQLPKLPELREPSGDWREVRAPVSVTGATVATALLR